MGSWVRGHPVVVVAAAVLVAAGLAGVAVHALAGGFDDTSVVRVRGDEVQVVRVALVDRAIGFDVSPDVIEVDAGTHVVLDVVNEAGGAHDLAVDGGPRTELLDPGARQRLDLGRVSGDVGGHCTIGDHDIAGMTVRVEVA